MPSGKGIKRIIELALDRASALRMQREAQEALARGTDPKRAKRNLEEAERAMERVGARIKSFAAGIGAALVAAFSIQKVKEFGEAAVREFMAAEAVWNRLGSTLRNAGVNLANVRAELERNAMAFARSTPFDDEQYADTLQRLVATSNDYKGSLRAVQVVADLAVKKQLDLETAATLVGKAMNGNISTLSRYGIEVHSAATAVDDIAKATAGAAAAQLGPFAQSLHNINVEWGNFKEEIGGILVEMVQASGGIDGVATSLEEVTNALQRDKAQIVAWGAVIISIAKALWQSIMTPFRALWLLRAAFVDSLQEMFNLLLAASARVAIAVVNKINDASGLIKQFSGGIVDLGRIDTSGLARIQNDAMDAAYRHGQDLIRRIRTDGYAILADLGHAYQDVGTSFANALNGGFTHAEPDTGGGGGGGGGGVGGGGRGTGRRMPNLSGRTPNLNAPGLYKNTGGISTAEGFLLAIQQEQLQRAVDAWRSAHADIEQMTQDTAQSVADAWGDAFALIITGAGNISDALKMVAAGAAQAAFGTLGKYADAKIAENIAMVFEARANAAAHGANPLTMGLVPGDIAAAHAAQLSVLKWSAYKALLGAGGGVAGAIGGGGAGGGYGGRDAGHSTARDAQMRGPEFHFYIDAFDPKSGRHQDLIGEAMKGVVERHGSDWQNARITVHPRRG